MEDNKKLSATQQAELLSILKARFEKNENRHLGIEWAKVQAKLEGNTTKLWSLNEMEKTGFCYDHEALEKRKENKPKNSAVKMATEMGIELLTEEQYRALQMLGNFDTKTSSCVKTPAEIRKLGGAIFADFRYGKVFVYHNGAESYYGARAFRGSLRV